MSAKLGGSGWKVKVETEIPYYSTKNLHTAAVPEVKESYTAQYIFFWLMDQYQLNI